MCRSGSEKCTVRIVAVFERSKSVICEIKCKVDITNCHKYPREVKVKQSRFLLLALGFRVVLSIEFQEL